MVKNVRILEAGHCFHPEKIVLPSGRWASRKFPANAVLIEHAKEGLILYDTGYSEHFAEATRRFPERLYALITPVMISRETTAAGRLRALGIRPEEIRHVIVSHFHADHAGGLKDFPKATYHFHGPAYARYRALPRALRVKNAFLDAFIPDDFLLRANGFTDESFRVGDYGLKGFEKGYDLFGDGSLALIPLPGHMEGQVGLLVRKGTESFFFVADAAWTDESIRRNESPSPVASLVMHDWRGYRKTLGALHKLSRVSPEIRILPCHCG